MCGIYGMVSLTGAPLRAPELMEAIGRDVRHRGPDRHGMWKNERAALGAERLRVVDLRHAADQPFSDPSSRVWLVFNGEVYNAGQLRKRYKTFPFRSRCDAETVLPLYLDKGSCGLDELDGMFALAIYDARSNALTLARDRAGEKPLFYRERGGEIWFASEVSALLRAPECDRTLDHEALGDYLTWGYVSEPKTMFRSVRKLEAGTIASFSGREIKKSRYWHPEAVEPTRIGIQEATNRLNTMLMNAVERQLTADVPVGVFTSGGVDSSLLAAMAAELLKPNKVRTFSVGFSEPAFDETPFAERLAGTIGTTHVAVKTTEQQLFQALDVVIERSAEPIADPAVLPTYVLAQRAKSDVTVALSGEGADELFGGYPTYVGHKLANRFGALPQTIRSGFHAAVSWLPVSQERKVTTSYLLKRFAAGAALPIKARHAMWFGTGIDPRILAGGGLAQPAGNLPAGNDPAAQAMLFDYCTYLRENLLTKVDRSTMLSGIESRAPYLDQRVTKFGLSLDSAFKVRRFTTKWLLKEVAKRWLPRNIVYRRKRGLSVPISQWINNGLRSEVDRLLNVRHLERQGLLRVRVAQELLSEHRSGRADHGRAIWALFILQRWMERWVPEAR